MITVQAPAEGDRIRSLELTRELFGPDELPRGLADAGVLSLPRVG